MALEGSLKDFGLADILQLIYFQRKTGVLTLEGRMDRIRLLFIEGNIAGAESKRRIEDNRLGKILLKKGFIKDNDLRDALEEQRSTGAKIGNILIKKNLVEKEIVREILQQQINETAIQIFGWNEGTYEFASQGVPQDKEFPFALDTQHILMEGLRILDEWSTIRDKLTLYTVFTKKTESSSNLTDDEHEILNYVDGENDVSTIIDLSANDNFQVSNTLLSLMEKGLIEAADLVSAAAETLPSGPRKPSVFLSFLPVAVIVIAIIISFSSVMMKQSGDFFNFSAGKMIEQLRFQLEEYRISHAEYPEELNIIYKDTDPWGRPYIYRRAENSFYLASAGADGVEGTVDDIY